VKVSRKRPRPELDCKIISNISVSISTSSSGGGSSSNDNFIIPEPCFLDIQVICFMLGLMFLESVMLITQGLKS
jgi:hypothetical protein